MQLQRLGMPKELAQFKRHYKWLCIHILIDKYKSRQLKQQSSKTNEHHDRWRVAAWPLGIPSLSLFISPTRTHQWFNEDLTLEFTRIIQVVWPLTSSYNFKGQGIQVNFTEVKSYVHIEGLVFTGHLPHLFPQMMCQGKVTRCRSSSLYKCLVPTHIPSTYRQ